MTGGAILSDEHQSHSETKHREIPMQLRFPCSKQILLLTIVFDTHRVSLLYDGEQHSFLN